MDINNDMTTLSTVMEKLRKKGIETEFKMNPDGFSDGKGRSYNPEDLKIVKTYRFEGESDPADSAVLYLIEANDGRMGYSIDAYGVYSNHEDDSYDTFIRKIPMEDREEQQIFKD